MSLAVRLSLAVFALAFSSNTFALDEPIRVPENFFVLGCAETLMDWKPAMLPEGPRTLDPDDAELIDRLVDRVVISTDSNEPPHTDILVIFKKVTQARRILGWQADRLKKMGLTPTERDLFRYYLDSDYRANWKIFEVGGSADQEGVIFGPVWIPPHPARRIPGRPWTKVLDEQELEYYQLSKKLSTYKVLLHELFHFRSYGFSGHAGYFAILLDYSDVGIHSLLLEEVMANRAALGSLEEAFQITRLTYDKFFKQLLDTDPALENFWFWPAKRQLTFLQNRSELERAYTYFAFEHVLKNPKSDLRANWKKVTHIDLDLLIGIWKIAADHHPEIRDRPFAKYGDEFEEFLRERAQITF